LGSHQEGRVGFSLIGLTPPICCANYKPGPRFPTLCVMFFFVMFNEHC
jgi:hypothetical protein